MLHHRHEETNYCICSFIISTLLFLTNRIYNLPFLILQETGLMETRMPNWERGVANILFTIS